MGSFGLCGNYGPSEDIIRRGESSCRSSSSTRGVNLTDTVEHGVATYWLAAPFAPKSFMSAAPWYSVMSRAHLTEVSRAASFLVRLQRSTSNLQSGHVPKNRVRIAPLMSFVVRPATSTSEPGYPEFASLSTFPSRTFSAPKGFASRRLSRPYFMSRPLTDFHLQSFPHAR